MTYYWYNDNLDRFENHEVHKSSCSYMPNYMNATFIGKFEWDYEAMVEARTSEPYKKFDGCAYCMPSQHNS